MVDYGAWTLAGTMAEFTARGWPPVTEGKYPGSQFICYETAGSLTMTIEVRYSEPGRQRPELDAWYLAALNE